MSKRRNLDVNKPMSTIRYPAILVIMTMALLLFTLSCGSLDNYPPVIDGLGAEAEWALPSGSLQVTCNASDRDGDGLSYDWSTNRGVITGWGPEIAWTAPEEIGVCDITVMVDDGQGGNVTGSLTLISANGTLPIIENLIITADHEYLKEYSWGYKVGKEKEYDIECVASNTSGELVYEWLCDGGEITGDGSVIMWTAPNISCDVTITVVVFDTAGYMDHASVFLEVVSCSSCTFN
ncbi:MAG: hypothetical protein JSW22_05170 [Chloroflexota bacterium]|nr:MAG: hypothetical protein JSW22_05170 [Chloroflexota bacterium]